jgi:hypothetical protein
MIQKKITLASTSCTQPNHRTPSQPGNINLSQGKNNYVGGIFGSLERGKDIKI